MEEIIEYGKKDADEYVKKVIGNRIITNKQTVFVNPIDLKYIIKDANGIVGKDVFFGNKCVYIGRKHVESIVKYCKYCETDRRHWNGVCAWCYHKN